MKCTKGCDLEMEHEGEHRLLGDNLRQQTLSRVAIQEILFQLNRLVADPKVENPSLAALYLMQQIADPTIEAIKTKYKNITVVDKVKCATMLKEYRHFKQWEANTQTTSQRDKGTREAA